MIMIVMALGCAESINPPLREQLIIDQGVTSLDEGFAVKVDARIDFNTIPEDMGDAGVVVDMRPEVEFPLTPVDIVVMLGVEETQAGITNHISCRVLDQNGQEVNLDPTWGSPRFDLRPLTGWSWSDEDAGLVMGEQVGEYEARCYFPSLGLRSTPQTWLVSPGEPKRVITRVDTTKVAAGEIVEAQCDIFDAYENPIEESDLDWILEPAIVDLDDREVDRVRFEPIRTGDYQLTCALADAMGAELFPALVEVTPGLPAALNSEFTSGRQIYTVGEMVELSSEVIDQYENIITGIELSSRISPLLPRFGDRRFYADRAGSYTATISVEGETLNDVPLEVRRSFLVEDGAPRILCESPLTGEQTTLSSVEVTGRVIDISDVTRFTVNGVSVPLNNQGRFSTQVNPTWGLNVVELVAEDQFGAESFERCMFFAAGYYLSEDRAINDVALLHLSQDAVDDSVPRSPIGSLGDLLGEMLNSDELVNTIDNALEAQNPIVSTECRFSTFLGCVFSAGAVYESLEVGGENSISLRLISGGVEVDAIVRNIGVGLNTTGTIDQGGTVYLDSARVVAQLNISLSGGVPQVTVRGEPSVTLGNITLSLDISFSIARSVINALLNTILNAFEGLITDQLSSTLEQYITSEVDHILSVALNSLDLSALGFNLNLPRPFGIGSYRLGLTFALNRLDVTSSRMRMGMSSLVSGSRTQFLSIEGVPSPTGLRRVELSPGFNNDSAGAAHVTLLNSVLARLWRGKYFDASVLPASTGGEFGLQLQLLVPPAVELNTWGNRATLHFGPAVAEITIPALFDDPITLNLGGIGSTSISLVGETLNFNQITIDQLYLSSPGFVMSEEGSDAIDRLLVDVIQSLLDGALNEALPSFPIPDFALPNSLSAYGVPRGTRLGVRGLSLTQDGARLIVKGDLR